MKRNILYSSFALLFAFTTQAQLVTTYAGAGVSGYAEGTLLTAKFAGLEQMAYDKEGNLLICDSPNNRIRKIDKAGNVSTFAGTGEAGLVNGPLAAAKFNNPIGIAVDNWGNIYVSDNLNFVVRKIDTHGNVTTLAGSGERGYTDSDAQHAKFDYVNYLCVDDKMNVYVADPNNNVIRKIDAQQNVSTFVGSGKAALTDGPGTSGELSFPVAIAFDQSNNVFYVSDQGNSAIRKVLPDGTMTTYAGTGTIGHNDGWGTNAKFYFPKGLAVDKAGNVYVGGRFDYTVRKIDTKGNVSTVAGIPHVSGNVNGDNTIAKFGKPINVVIAPDGNLLVSDWINNAIKKIELPTVASVHNYKNEADIQIAPNPLTTSTTIKVLNASKEPISFSLYDVTGKEVKSNHNVSGQQINVERGELNSGIYFFKLVQNNKVIATEKLIVE